MRRKILLGIIGGAVFLIIGLVLGLIAGMNIGGNYFVDFEFGGVRGYEAVGKIGAILGTVLGAAAGAILGVKVAGRLGK
ncbi:MAG: hypothetical protein WC877_08765 [Dehalococcoidales bacterium]|jgi:hypothetical protein